MEHGGQQSDGSLVFLKGRLLYNKLEFCLTFAFSQWSYTSVKMVGINEELGPLRISSYILMTLVTKCFLLFILISLAEPTHLTVSARYYSFFKKWQQENCLLVSISYICAIH